MADKKISELDAITGANTAATDVFVVVDTSTGQTKKITREELNNAIEQDVLSSIDIDTINGDFSVNGNINLGDNNKAIFGAGSDLQIYHTGSDSVIQDAGQGDLYIKASNNFWFQGNTSNDIMARFQDNGAVTLYYDNSAKLATTSTGIDVTGTVTADGLTVANTGLPTITIQDQDGTNQRAFFRQSASTTIITSQDGTSYGQFLVSAYNGTNTINRFRVSSGGDISFYEDTGTTAKLFWDASAERLGLGTSSPQGFLEIVGSTSSAATSGGTLIVRQDGDANTDGIALTSSNAISHRIWKDSSGRLNIGSSSYPSSLVQDVSGNLGIGTTSPQGVLHIVNSGLANQLRVSNTTADATTKYGTVLGSHYTNSEEPITGMLLTSSSSSTGGSVSIGGGISSANAVNTIKFYTAANNTTLGGSEKARLDASGNLLVGKTSTSSALTTAGVDLRPEGRSFMTRSAGPSLYLSRTTSDGNIAEFYKDGSTIGSIGVTSSRMYAGTGDTGLFFNDQLDSIDPWNTSTNAARDNAIDLGDSTRRFKDLYLSNSAYVKNIGGISDTDTYLNFGDVANTIKAFTGGSERMRIDSSGRVGIGTSSPTQKLTVANGYGIFEGIKVGQNGTDIDSTFLGANSLLAFKLNGTERMRITSSGDVLVGKSSSSLSTAGFQFFPTGVQWATAANTRPLLLNRTASDGTIAEFRKDGSIVGSIGVYEGSNDYPYIGRGDTGFLFVAEFDNISPWDISTNSGRDNAIDLGGPTLRWDDIYATNGTIQTSDQNEKQQIASLTDAEITAAKAISKLFKTFKWNDKVEAKGDAARTHTGVIAQDVQQAMTDAGLDAGDYAFFISTTWWETQTEVPAVEADEENGIEAADAYTRTDTYETAEEAPEGATERTRLGIRYPELLAFIGAATEQRLADIETRLTALEN